MLLSHTVVERSVYFQNTFCMFFGIFITQCRLDIKWHDGPQGFMCVHIRIYSTSVFLWFFLNFLTFVQDIDASNLTLLAAEHNSPSFSTPIEAATEQSPAKLDLCHSRLLDFEYVCLAQEGHLHLTILSPSGTNFDLMNYGITHWELMCWLYILVAANMHSIVTVVSYVIIVTIVRIILSYVVVCCL